MRVDKECHLYDDWHDQLLCAKNMHEGDMAIAFSYSGLTQEVLDCTAEAQRHNCPVVAVTKVDGSSNLATMADAVLGVAASEPLVRSGAMASRMAQLMVVDALYAAYVASDYERATHVIKQKRNTGTQREHTLHGRLEKQTTITEATNPTKKNSTVWATRRTFAPTHMRMEASRPGWTVEAAGLVLSVMPSPA